MRTIIWVLYCRSSWIFNVSRRARPWGRRRRAVADNCAFAPPGRSTARSSKCDSRGCKRARSARGGDSEASSAVGRAAAGAALAIPALGIDPTITHQTQSLSTPILRSLDGEGPDTAASQASATRERGGGPAAATGTGGAANGSHPGLALLAHAQRESE